MGDQDKTKKQLIDDLVKLSKGNMGLIENIKADFFDMGELP